LKRRGFGFVPHQLGRARLHDSSRRQRR
jgi:hypothetical protein